LHCTPVFCFFFNATATPEIYTLSLHDALPISPDPLHRLAPLRHRAPVARPARRSGGPGAGGARPARAPCPRCVGVPLEHRRQSRSEEHTSELQSRGHLVCRLLLEKKKQLSTPH